MKFFEVSKTYDVITPESAKNASYDEELSGYEYLKKSMNLKDLINELDSIHYFENFNENDLVRQSLYSIDPIIDYVNGHETTEAFHIEAISERAMKRLNKVLKNRYFKR